MYFYPQIRLALELEVGSEVNECISSHSLTIVTLHALFLWSIYFNEAGQVIGLSIMKIIVIDWFCSYSVEKGQDTPGI